jgi:hypothetical protein
VVDTNAATKWLDAVDYLERPGVGWHANCFQPKNGKSPPPSISPIFEYPSDKHFGELKK